MKAALRRQLKSTITRIIVKGFPIEIDFSNQHEADWWRGISTALRHDATQLYEAAVIKYQNQQYFQGSLDDDSPSRCGGESIVSERETDGGIWLNELTSGRQEKVDFGEQAGDWEDIWPLESSAESFPPIPEKPPSFMGGTSNWSLR
jgi:hypothetical protein